jgi:hypothetical protein
MAASAGERTDQVAPLIMFRLHRRLSPKPRPAGQAGQQHNKSTPNNANEQSLMIIKSCNNELWVSVIIAAAASGACFKSAVADLLLHHHQTLREKPTSLQDAP